MRSFINFSLVATLSACLPSLPVKLGPEDTGDSVVQVADTADSSTDSDSQSKDSDSMPQDSDSGATCQDLDGDGYGDIACGGTDCNDASAEINAGASEVCNEVDDNCDGITDGDAVDIGTWFEDLDGDGYGSTSAVTACAQPDGSSHQSGDCDDTNPSAHPGNSEVCDDIDNDCEGSVDVGAADASTHYYDADGDGYGDATRTQIGCEASSGFVADPTDCNDADAEVNPSESEVCNEVDDDCDGTADDGLPQSTYYRDADGDLQGDPLISVSTCNGAPSGYVEILTDCDDTNINVYVMASELCDGVDNDCDAVVDEPGNGPTWFLDADGDGFGNDNEQDNSGDCAAPDGYVSDNSDCDDTAASAFPGGTEVCDELDNDCDGSRDGSDATDIITWYPDGDLDGYGDLASAGVVQCEAPVGSVASATDCDDADDQVYPGAEEVCTDTFDRNCDGSVGYADQDGDGAVACEECDDTNAASYPGAAETCDGVDNDCVGGVDNDAVDMVTWYQDSDGDGYGDASVSSLTCEEPSSSTQDATDCNDADAGISPSAAEICNEVDDNCVSGVDEGEVCSIGGDSGGVDSSGGSSDTGGSTDSGSGLDSGSPPDTGSGSGDSDSSSDSDSATGGGDTSVSDSDTSSGDSIPVDSDSGIAVTVLFVTDFGDQVGSDPYTCSYSPFSRSDGGSMAYASYDDGAGGCGVYIFGSGSSSAPAVALQYSLSGLTAGETYTASMSVMGVDALSTHVLASFGGPVAEAYTSTVAGEQILEVSVTADASGAATLQVWTTAGNNYQAYVKDLVVSY